MKKIVEKIVQKRDAEEISVCYFWSIILMERNRVKIKTLGLDEI